jgi:hypothetical protein
LGAKNKDMIAGNCKNAGVSRAGVTALGVEMIIWLLKRQKRKKQNREYGSKVAAGNKENRPQKEEHYFSQPEIWSLCLKILIFFCKKQN